MRSVPSRALRIVGKILLVVFLVDPPWDPLERRRIWLPVYDHVTRSSGR